MAVETLRGHVVLATWKGKGGRICFLGRETGGESATYAHHDAFYKPAPDVAAALELQLVMQPDLVEGVLAMRQALLLARRAIEAGKEFNLILQDAAGKAGVELEAISDQAEKYNRALSLFERKHGRGAPMNEDLTR